MSTPVWVVKSVQPQPDYSLLLTFVGGEKKYFDMKPYLGKAIYSKLNNLSFFMNAKAEYGTVIWDDDTDIAPEFLWETGIPM